MSSMDNEERRRINQWIRQANAQRRTVIEQLESRARQLDITQTLLRRHLKAAGLEAVDVQLHERIDPLNSGPSMHSDAPEQRQAFHDIAPATTQRDTEPKPWWPSIDDPQGPIKPSPGWQNMKLLDKPARSVGIMLLGQPREVIDRVVATMVRQQTQRSDFTPIFIIDSDYTDPFLRYGFVIEMVPAPEEQQKYSGTRPWDTYVLERLEAIRDKWYVVQFLEFGTPRYTIKGLADERAEEAEQSITLENHSSPRRLGKIS